MFCALCVTAGALPGGEAQPQQQSPGKSTMWISYERSGGLAGTSLTVTIDADTLSPEDARQLRELVDAADFFALPAVITATTPGADRFQYKLTVETGERRHTVEIHEAAAPAALQPLLDW